MSKITVLSIWFGCCVAIGLLLAYADGIETLALAKASLLMAMLGLATLLVLAAFRRIRANRKSG